MALELATCGHTHFGEILSMYYYPPQVEGRTFSHTSHYESNCVPSSISLRCWDICRALIILSSDTQLIYLITVLLTLQNGNPVKQADNRLTRTAGDEAII